ncbi:DUF3108 domain-containing protein [Acuticoccus mangrovi]|uniref:DUF3108 domain-containing protein n=1 Tax=Acuticoccus mangrovi TaxID=2796142 RepID=A0A934ITE3_9HYPH|nr:DUF3108 domain-containing protein [Acuticoccus mangrovi]MBJ3778400.1 DUF3108 domain-containing protein [Acuticoccus mangrovi]
MRAWTCVAVAAAMTAVVIAPSAGVTAPEKISVDAVYEISIAGWGIARASLDLTLEDGRYEADLFMQPKGVAKIVTAVRTSVAAAGAVRGDRVLPDRYKVRATETDRPVAVDMDLNAGTVTSLRARPPLKQKPGRVPVTTAHKRGIVDPLSSGLLPIRSHDGRDACRHTLRIFDGWTRYDVRLSFKRFEDVATEGYKGQVAVCGARWVPVSGHRPAKKEVQYLADNKMLEMSVIALPNAGVAIPYRVSIGTPNGEILIVPSRMHVSGPGA